MRWDDCTWEERKAAQDLPVIIPLGSMEQHGPHLPLATDTLIAEALAENVADEIGGVIAPTLSIGVSDEHDGFPGTLSLSPQTLTAVLTDVKQWMKHCGDARLYILNAHGGNSELAAQFAQKQGIKVLDAIKTVKRYDHAGELETSIMLYLHPKKVRVEKIAKQEFDWPGKKKWKTADYSKSGVLGDPTTASAQKGRDFFEKMVQELVRQIKDE